MRDNLLWCLKDALHIKTEKRMFIRRNTILGSTAFDLEYSTMNDTIVSNTFSNLTFATADNKGAFFAYNDIPVLKNPIPAGIGKAALINVKGDSCDYYYNIFKDPLIVDSTTGGLGGTSPCFGAGFGGENIGVYQSTPIIIKADMSKHVRSSGFKVLSVQKKATGTVMIVELPFSMETNGSLTIYALSGKKVTKNFFVRMNNAGSGNAAIHVHGFFADGTYLFGLDFGGSRHFGRFTFDH